MHTKIYHFLLVSTLIFVIGFFSSTSLRASENLVSGYAWADDIGWISMSGESPTYGVKTPTDDGPIIGYAWSDNWGWIQFDAGCPDGVYGPCSAEKVGNTWQGFAKILNMNETCQNPPINGVIDNCGATGEGLYATSFAGFISLSSVNDHNPSEIDIQSDSNSWGVEHSAEGVISGYGWNPIVGWVEFDASTTEEDQLGPLGFSGGGDYCSDVVPGTINFSWTAQADPCTGEGEWGPLSFSPGESSYEVTTPMTPGTYTYILICNGISDSETIEILDATSDPSCVDSTPSVTLEISQSTLCANMLGPVNLIYDTNMNSCTGDWTAQTLPGPGSYSTSDSPTSDTTYTISCGNGTETVTDSVSVDILPASDPLCNEDLYCSDPTATNYLLALPCTYDYLCPDGTEPPCALPAGGDKPIFEEF